MVARIACMRTFVSIVLTIAILLGAIALYLYATTPNQATALRFPVTASQRELLARVPASADAFALIPTAALLHRKLVANNVTRDSVEAWVAEQEIPSPLLVGGADVVAWRVGKRTAWAIRLDVIRAFLVRIWMMSSNVGLDARWDGRVFVINGGYGARIDKAALDDLLSIAAGLPEADVVVVQRNSVRGMFPPIGRPSVTSVRVTPQEILLTSRARSDKEPSGAAVQARHPSGALIAATFAETPRIFSEVSRLVGTDLGALVGDGGAIALYDIDPGTLLPQPKGLLIVPATEKARRSMKSIGNVAEMVGETRDTGKELLVSFDRRSLGTYINDASVPATWPANQWALRIDSERMAPILERLGDSRGLRFAAPRIHRAVRDLRRWTSVLKKADSIEAADSISAGFEELRVRLATK